MARVTVTPETFTLVHFDAGRIAELVGEVADRVGLPADVEVRVDVDERVPLGRSRLVSLDPVTLAVQGGAFENAKAPRTLSDRSVVDVVGRLLFRAADRLDPRFADAPADEGLTLQQHTAWDAYAIGRCERAGYAPSKGRRLYHFRNRHGFTDTADRVFERLWSAEDLSWADIEAACAETAAARAA
ncbi:MAG TPA: hypothetical protein VGB03_09805 [Acidimicrobiales bacterium]|jgi:hypothetical protein